MKVKLGGEFFDVREQDKAEVLRCEEVWCHQVECGDEYSRDCEKCELLAEWLLPLDRLEVIYDEED